MDKKTNIPIAIEDLRNIDQLDGWERVPETLEVDRIEAFNQVTNVYRFEGRFFSVSVPHDLDKAEASANEDDIFEVFPHQVAATVYKDKPQEPAAAPCSICGRSQESHADWISAPHGHCHAFTTETATTVTTHWASGVETLPRLD